MLTVPAVPPVTTPVDEPTVAVPVPDELDQWPPVLISDKVILDPEHTVGDPVGLAGGATIVTFIATRALRQPAIFWATQYVVTPSVVVEGIGAVKLPVPPVAVVYQIRVPVPVALSGPAVEN